MSSGNRAASAAAARAASFREASRGRSEGSERILSTSSGFGGGMESVEGVFLERGGSEKGWVRERREKEGRRSKEEEVEPPREDRTNQTIIPSELNPPFEFHDAPPSSIAGPPVLTGGR